MSAERAHPRAARSGEDVRQGLAHQPSGQIELGRDLAHAVRLCDLERDPDVTEALKGPLSGK
jgi:hypothetical protein